MNTYKQSERLGTPETICMWPHLRQPGEFKGKPTRYQITLLFDPAVEEHKQFLSAVRQHWTEGKAELEANGQPCNKELWQKFKNKDGTETGQYSVKFSTDYAPPLFDAQNRKIPDSIDIGSKSKVKVCYTWKPYEHAQGNGVILYLQAVQVLDLVEVGGNATDYGFAETSGYNAPSGDAYADAHADPTQEEYEASQADMANTIPDDDIPF